MGAFLGLIVILAIGGALIFAGVRIAIPSMREKTIEKFPITGMLTKKWWAPYVIIGIGLSCVSGGLSNFNASTNGFPDAATYEAAKKEGISSYDEYQAFLAEKADKESLAKEVEQRTIRESERYTIDVSGDTPVVQVKPTSSKYFVEDSRIEPECARLLTAAGPVIEEGYAKKTPLKDVKLAIKDLEIDDAALLFTVWTISQAYYSNKEGFLSEYQQSTSDNVWKNTALIAACKTITQQKHEQTKAEFKSDAAQNEKDDREAEANARFQREMSETCNEWATAMNSCATAGDIQACMNIRYQGGGSADICNTDGSPRW